MRLFSVLVNAGADATAEDGRGHNAQYYMDNQGEVTIPEWSKKWSNMIEAQSPPPRRKTIKSEKSAVAKERNALTRANMATAKSARRKKREGKPPLKK